ncbi:hypothetical protein K466DRAFT_553255 [Polyporus arcularius HHB13444]|uniref:BTB domain-containing protein n=1 Tax=Polyporus arcularius HHB13444 TaxID=1314778 RepID=A0A5C3P587_9APHY|nr:hypothetical protein K466DRAFT_553255 [Polyporus arcularius HHB13444]
MHQTDLEGVTRDDEFWADDVHVVLIAQGTAFRVRKETLSSVSPVFADMFKNAQPGEETWDGCPMVRLSDSAVDLRRFLNVVVKVGLDASEDCTRWRSRGGELVCSVLASVVRVAHKYQADRVANAAADRIEKAVDYAPWTQDGRDLEKHAPGKITLLNAGVKITLPQDAVEVVNLARIINRRAWLPHALHLCCSVGDLDILRRGITRDDGQVEALSEDDHARCKRAVPLLEALCCETALRTYDPSNKYLFRRCTAKAGLCEGVMKGLLVAFALKGIQADILNISCENARYDSSYRRHVGFCPQCHGWMLEHVKSLDRMAIRKLPACFALEEDTLMD